MQAEAEAEVDAEAEVEAEAEAEAEMETEKTAVSEDSGSGSDEEKKRKIHSCPHCGIVYVFKGCLKKHIQTVHTQKKTDSHFKIISCFGRTRSQRTLSKVGYLFTHLSLAR